MKTLFILTLMATVAVGWQPAQARSIVECIDQAGNVTFASQTCPAGTTKRADKRVAGPEPGAPDAAADMAKIAAKSPVVMFSVKPCDSCDLIRLVLQKRGIPFTEKDAGADVAVQAELRKATGGQLSVPTVTVGTQVVTGYNKSALESALDGAGYPPPPAGAQEGASTEAKAATTGGTAPPTDTTPPDAATPAP